MHGNQKIELTYASVQEAFADYLSKHLAAGVKITVSEWKAETVYAGGIGSVAVTFSQEPQP